MQGEGNIFDLILEANEVLEYYSSKSSYNDTKKGARPRFVALKGDDTYSEEEGIKGSPIYGGKRAKELVNNENWKQLVEKAKNEVQN